MEQKIRVGIDGHMLGDKSGGNERYYFNLLEHMQIPSNMEAFLFVREGADVQKFTNRFNVVYFKSHNAFFRNFIELNQLCNEYKLDVLHTQYFIPFFCRSKLVCTIHDICFEHYKNIFTISEFLRQKLLIPFSARYSNCIVTVSNYSKKDIAETYNVNEDKVIVAQGGANDVFKKIRISEESKNRLKTRFNIISKKFVLTVGNLQPRKNLNRLIEAFNLFKSENDEDLQLVIVGKKAWMYDSIISEAIKNSNSIVLTDYVTNEDLVMLYNMTDLFIYPSIFEGFGFPPLEALCCGAKVAVSRTSSLPEAVGKAGLFFNPFDITDIKEKIKLGLSNEFTVDPEEVNKQIYKYNWSDAANTIIGVYNNVVIS